MEGVDRISKYCIYATPMSVGQELQEARLSAGLSRNEVARRAGVSLTTVSRTEEGVMDPTVTMLERLYSALDLSVDMVTREVPEISITHLHDAFEVNRWGVELKWTRIRVFIDLLTRKPKLTAEAIADPPRRSGVEELDVMLAAIAEKLADDVEIQRPRWCASVPPMSYRWEHIGTPRMKAKAANEAPAQFRERNIFLSDDGIWRRK